MTSSTSKPIQVWLRHLEQLNPLHIELGLERVRAVWTRLPQIPDHTKVVTVGGTNGKGSTVLLLEKLMQCAGYSTGAYLSPHLLRFNERVRLDGVEISDAELCRCFEQVERARQDVDLTYFEFTTLAALVHFARVQPDVILLEVGLGGRLDAVNLVDPDIAIISSIDLDHQDWLGDTREQIGREKAGIFRRDRWALYAGADMPASVADEASRLGAKLLVAGRDMKLRREAESLNFELQHGVYQLSPVEVSESALIGALGAAQLLLEKIPQKCLDSLVSLRLPGRFERLEIDGHDIVLDCAHNPAAASLLRARLQEKGIAGAHFVLGMMKDKDVEGFLEVLAPLAGRWTLVQPDTPRAMAATELCARVRRISALPVAVCEQVSNLKIADLPPGETTVVTGSFYTVGEFCRDHLGDTKRA